MKNGESFSRRRFVKGITAALVMAPFFQFCTNEARKLMVRLTKTNHVLGHRLWAKNFPTATSSLEVPYLIVGGGISGLSAARQLSKIGIQDFLLLEMENHVGGNSSGGENRYSKYPLGAHYLPLPNFHDKELLSFLEESRIILSYDEKGLPVFDETQMSFAPEERLFFKNEWQEGLVPKLGILPTENAEFERFFRLMEGFRTAKGADGKYLFDIPLQRCSGDEATRQLDKISMAGWLEENHFSAKVLFDYLDYCCRDDFGLDARSISAYAGIHYFAARKHDATADAKDNVLTWPEGNSRLASRLKKYSESKTLKQHLAFDVKMKDEKVVVSAFNNITGKTIEIKAGKVIMATPQFVNQYLLPGRKKWTSGFHYAPWLLATLTVDDLSDNGSFPLCWDNVLYGSKGLGYIYDQQQNLGQVTAKKVITYYHSFTGTDQRKSRKDIYGKTESYWKQFVFDDLKIAHPEIEELTSEIRIHLIGHGMISPVTGFLFSEEKENAAQPIGDKIFFAHSDLSGMSIFEEAFHQGINAVNRMIHATTLDT